MAEFIKTSIDQRGVTTVKINRPDVHNAFNETVIKELQETFEALSADEETRVVVLTGEGASFSAGADLNWMKRSAEFSLEENQADAVALSEMLSTIAACPKPTLAYVNGAAFGGGVGLVSCCDMGVALTSAQFALSEVRLGLTPATISPYVVRAIGSREAQRYFLTGERFDGIEARRLGLVNEVAQTPEEADMILDGLISHLLAGAPGAQAACKELIRYVDGREINDSVQQETARRIAERRTGDEGQEGLQAFLGKRKPNWSN